MENLERVLAVLGAVAMLTVLLVNMGFDLVGGVVWEPVTEIDYFTQSEIESIWSEIFYENNSDISIFYYVDSSEDIKPFFALKGDASEICWILSGGKFESFNLNETTYVGYWFNLSDDGYTLFDSAGDYTGVVSFLVSAGSNPLLTNNWIIYDSGDAEQKFEGVFRLPLADVMTYDSDGFFIAEDVLIEENKNITYANRVGDNNFSSMSFFSAINTTANITTTPILTQNISDFIFDVNSSWNFAFNINDYFSWSNGVSGGAGYFDIEAMDDDNINGEWINFSINAKDIIFMPKQNFTGTREFRVAVNNFNGSYTYSNNFNVTISVLNHAPILIIDIPFLFVPGDGGVNVFLDTYFKDVDGDDLSYRVVGGDNINVSFNESIMTIRLSDNFNVFTEFWVYVSDGKEEVKSNRIYVYKDENSTTTFLIDILENSSVDNLNNSVDNKTLSKINIKDIISSWNKNNWVLGGVIIFILSVIMFIIWFFILRKNNLSDNSPASSDIVSQNKNNGCDSPINNYLKKLNLPKG